MTHLDFGLDFRSAAERVRGERGERHALAARELKFNVPVLDQAFGGLLPHDLMVVGAATGVGKTTLISLIAESNAKKGKNVHLFALEAEPKEIERHIKYRMLVDMFYAGGDTYGKERLNYRDWYRGKLDELLGKYEDEAEYDIEREYSTLFTFYRGSQFGPDDIERTCRAIQDQTDLVIIDHLHYIDVDDENENRGVKAIVKRTRDVSLSIGKPVILVAHLHKRGFQERKATLMPDIDSFHGSSDITKIATLAAIVARGKPDPTQPWLAETYMRLPKDRMEGSTAFYVMKTLFNLRRGRYDDQFVVGTENGANFEALDRAQWPTWARDGRPQ